MKMANTTLVIGKDIQLDRGEKLLTYKNRINGDIVYTTNKYKSRFIDGQEFINVFPRPLSTIRKVQLMRKDSLERIAHEKNEYA